MRVLEGDPQVAYALARGWALGRPGKILREEAPRSFSAKIGRRRRTRAIADPTGRRIVSVQLQALEDTFRIAVSVSPPRFYGQDFALSPELARHAAGRIIHDLWETLYRGGIVCQPEPKVKADWRAAFDLAGLQIRRGIQQYTLATLISFGVAFASYVSGLGLRSPLTAFAGIFVGWLALDGLGRIIGGRRTRKVARSKMESEPAPPIPVARLVP